MHWAALQVGRVVLSLETDGLKKSWDKKVNKIEKLFQKPKFPEDSLWIESFTPNQRKAIVFLLDFCALPTSNKDI